MDRNSGAAVLVRVHKRKLLEAVDVLAEARQRLLSAEAEVDSSLAIRRQAAQAQLRSRQVLAEAAGLVASAERLVLEARFIRGEYRRPYD